MFVNAIYIVDDIDDEGRSRGGQTRKDQLGHEGYQEIGQRGGQTRKDHQLGHELDSKERQEVDAKERQELDAKAKHGETVVPGGTGGKSLEAQEHLADGNSIYIFLTPC